jgi:hypothetical protein
MSNKKQAFPGITIEQRGDSAYNAPTRVYYSGMSLRDYFAAKAMQGSLNGCMCKDCGTIEQRVEESYQIADAMLKERDK